MLYTQAELLECFKFAEKLAEYRKGNEIINSNLQKTKENFLSQENFSGNKTLTFTLRR